MAFLAFTEQPFCYFLLNIFVFVRPCFFLNSRLLFSQIEFDKIIVNHNLKVITNLVRRQLFPFPPAFASNQSLLIHAILFIFGNWQHFTRQTPKLTFFS
jgi:hypothetical protein